MKFDSKWELPFQKLEDVSFGYQWWDRFHGPNLMLLCLGRGLLLRNQKSECSPLLRRTLSRLCNAWPLIAQNKDLFFSMFFLLVHFIADSDNHRTVSLNKIYGMRHKSPITDFSFFKVLLDGHMIMILWSSQFGTCVALCIYAFELSSTLLICHHPFPKSSPFFYFLFLLKLNAKDRSFGASIYWKLP